MEQITLPQFPSHASCTLCELHQEARNPGVPTVHYEQSVFPSPEVPPLIIMGANPGFKEDQQNEPFVGPSGELLKNVYLSHKEILENTTVYLTNAARCATPGIEQAPKRSHLKCCWSHTEQDLRSILNFHKPRGFLLVLGQLALDSVTKNLFDKSWSLKKAFSNQGAPPTALFQDRLNLFTTFHPAAILKRKNYLYPVSDHLLLLGQAIIGKIPEVTHPSLIKPRSPIA